jgi:hypothetical protein
MYKIFLLLLIFIFASCSYLPFTKKKDDSAVPKDTAAKTAPKTDKKAEKIEKIEEKDPKPGDIKVIDGVQYIYTSNRKFMLNTYEPEYVWVRKDQFTPRMGEALLSGGTESKKEREEMEKRIAKLEEDLKKKGIAPYMVYPQQMGAMPSGMGFMPSFPLIAFNYPSPKMKRRVIVMPFIDQSNYKEEGLGELATKRLISRLENTNAIICVDPNNLQIQGVLTDSPNLKILNEVYGIQAVIKGALSDVYTSSSKIQGKEERETSFAMSKISLEIYNTDTNTKLKQFSGRNPISLTREKGDMSSEKSKIKAIDLSIEIIAEDLLKAILTLDWHGRIASIENDKVYINAGRLSGLEKGSILEVYSIGEQVIDAKTNIPLGMIKGNFKGELEVAELFGVDASWAKIKKGGNFSSADLVYFQK